MSKIRQIERDINRPSEKDPNKNAYRYRWEVHAEAKIFGGRIRKFFKTKGEAKAEKLTLETKLQNQQLTPLTQEIHLCVARFQKQLTVEQMEAALSRAVVYPEQSDIDLKTMAADYLSQLKKRHERGHVGDLYIKLHGGVAPRLADEWLGDIKLRDITKKMCEDFIEDRIAEGLAPHAAKNYA